MYSLTSDYMASKGDPSPYLRKIAEAGFSYTHWCHQWNTDFIYNKSEIDQIERWLKEYGLKLLDLHGSMGQEKSWGVAEEYRRLAGYELVANRLEMTARLGGGVVIMHAQFSQLEDGTIEMAPMMKTLDELEPLARCLGVKIAIENGNWEVISSLLAKYSPEFLGLCYDCGHGNLGYGKPDFYQGYGLDQLDIHKERLISVHLHDNDGVSDQHRLPFTATVDWERLAKILAVSGYTKCVSLETTAANEGEISEEEFLAKAYRAAARLTEMIESYR
ncbi:MAG: sugar phosphate isomerase/epimerase [Lentisphaerae bacterium]|nr:sugar phosphate isomerase/epimerase [Lentisphaerota bacterium]